MVTALLSQSSGVTARAEARAENQRSSTGSLADSCKDYAWLITQGEPYKDAWAKYQATGDLHALIAALAAE